MITLLFDEQGNGLRPTAALGASLGTWIRGDDLSEFLVRNLGFVSIVADRAAVRLSFRPGKSDPTALSAAMIHLFGLRAPSFIVRWYESGWRHEDFPSSGQAIQRIVDLTQAAQLQARQADFLSRSFDRHRLPAVSPLASIMAAWACGMRNVGELLAIDRGAGSRSVVVAAGQSNADPHVLTGEIGLAASEPVWLERNSRFRIADWPDVEYGKWVAQTYGETLDKAEPRLDAVDCIIKWPRIGARRYTYRRLILPCRTPSGAQVLLGTMLSDDTVSLRTQLH